MIGTIRKHQQWLWVLIIAATIVSFVIFFNPASRFGGGGGGGAVRAGETGATIQGRAITTEELTTAARAAQILYFFQHGGEWPKTADLNSPQSPVYNMAYQNIALGEKAKELGIHPTPKATAQVTEQFLMRLGIRPEDINGTVLQNVEKQLLAPQKLNLEDWTHFAEEQVMVNQLVALFGMSGKLITPKEAEAFYVRENEPAIAEIAYFPLSNYMAQVNVTLQQATNFFKTNESKYWLPERVQVQYVSFPMSNYLATADKDLSSNTNLSKEIDAYYMQRGPKSFVDTNGTEMTPDAAKTMIKNDLRDKRALTFARTNANALIVDLMAGRDDEHPFTLDDLQKAASAKGLKVNVTEPFDRRSPPKELKPTQAFVNAAFSLSTNTPDDKSRSMTYVPSPIPVGDGWVVMGFKSRFQAKPQTFDQVQTEVMDDYKREQAFMIARNLGIAFHNAAAAAMAQGKSFDSIAASNKVGVVTLPAFSLNTATNLQSPAEIKKMEATSPYVAHLLSNHSEFQQLVENAYTLQTGKISEYNPSILGGFIVYVKSRQPVDPAKLQKELPEYLARMRDQRANAAFAQWFQKQAQEMRLTVPQAPREPTAG